MTEVIVSEDPENSGQQSPSEIVSRFLDANEALIDASKATVALPDEESFHHLYHSNHIANISFGEIATVLVAEDKEIESAEMALLALVQAVTELSDTALELRPDVSKRYIFLDDFVERRTKDLMDDDKEISADALNTISSVYNEASSNLLDKVMTSQPVIEFAMVRAQEERFKKMVHFGTIAAATFVGTSLALYLDRRGRNSRS